MDNSKITTITLTGIVMERDLPKISKLSFHFIRNWSNTSAFFSSRSVFVLQALFLQYRSAYTSSVELVLIIFSLSILLLGYLSYMNSRENVTLTLNVIYSK